jgi:hypothetical protein
VFFVTNNALVPQDTDLAADFYDARVNGGFPATAPAPTCQGDGCKPPETPAPPMPVAATVTFSGPGNVTGSTSASSSSRARAAIAVLSHRLAGDRIEIRVTVPARGRLSIAGAGVRGSARYVGRGGTYTLIARLKPRAMAAVATKHKLRLAIRVRYVPAAGRASAAVVYLTVKA